MRFADLGLSEPILRAVAAEGYTTATPIQSKAIIPALEGRDVLGCAQTGTGKTAAFALPILHRLSTTPRPAGPPRVRCLVLCPTRELATQISDSFRTYGKNLGLSHAVVFGGVNQHPQAAALRRGVDVLIATPGRLLDLINQRLADLSRVEVLVLDEADRMLDMGFIQDIRRIVATLPPKRQTMLFSATIPSEIRSLASSLMRDPVNVQVAAIAPTADGVEQSIYFVDKRNKPVLLAHLVAELPMTRAIVFTRTKHGADRVVRHLHSRGIRAEAIHGNKSQNARERAMGNFRSNKIPVLVATDIAARGIDIDGITHVVNYDLTHEPETYIHRIGRTARAGATGEAVSFCDPEEKPNLKAIEKLIRRTIPVRTNHPPYPQGESRPAHGSSHGESSHRASSHGGSQGRRGGAPRAHQPAAGHAASQNRRHGHSQAGKQGPQQASAPASGHRQHAPAAHGTGHSHKPAAQPGRGVAPSRRVAHPLSGSRQRNR